jgi:hypothetical protein
MAVGSALLLVTLMGAFSMSQTAATVGDDAVRLTRVKPADSEMRLVLDGISRSPGFRALVDEIHHFNVIVVIQFGSCANGRIRSCVSHVEGDERQRHVRIKVNTRATDDRLIATIAHELHHALEIAREPQVIDSRTALQLYRRIASGKCGQGLSEQCETDAAAKVEAKVNAELGRRQQ